MSITFVDRESTYPNRFLVTPESGDSYYLTLERADEPTVTGTPLNAETFNQLIADLTAMAEAAGVPLPSPATVGQFIRVKSVDDSGAVTATETAEVVLDTPVDVAEDGYTDISGLRQPTAMSVVQSDTEITITTTLQGDVESVSVVTLDSEGYPTTIVTDGVSCAVTWEGFEE